MRPVLVFVGLLPPLLQAHPYQQQKPLISFDALYRQPDQPVSPASRRLKGRFLHITDIHPDPFYQVHSSTLKEDACHRGNGSAGFYGAETSDCDSPLSLVNATFKWIEDNLKDSIDFVIWTGDSARHDNDESIPRNEAQVLGQNKLLVKKFLELFGTVERPGEKQVKIPVVPSFGNNDILPHNIFERGPNKWTKHYQEIWRPFIPEEQRHGFEIGGWFYVEVIPGKLAVFSLNTMYFFSSNSAVDGCASEREPGFEHFEWLRIQLELLRQRGVKAILSGHVPPARNDEKVGWDETCWQKYTLWLKQYRDVIVGSVYGHMNLEHFILQDFNDIDREVAAGYGQRKTRSRKREDDAFSITVNAPDYLNAQRKLWSKLPNTFNADRLDHPAHSCTPDCPEEEVHLEKDRGNDLGGQWAERFSVSMVTASVVPNYFSTLRVYEYNITNLNEEAVLGTSSRTMIPSTDVDVRKPCKNIGGERHHTHDEPEADKKKEKKKKKKKKKKHRKPNFTVPNPPPKGSPPGPAYSPQPLSWLGYTQYYANNTFYNDDFFSNDSALFSQPETAAEVVTEGWNTPNHTGEKSKDSDVQMKRLAFEPEYNTQEPKDAYNLGRHKDGLIMMKWVELAAMIGDFDPQKVGNAKENRNRDIDQCLAPNSISGITQAAVNVLRGWGLVKLPKDATSGASHKHKHREGINKIWYSFVSRAVVGTMNKKELEDRFGV